MSGLSRKLAARLLRLGSIVHAVDKQLERLNVTVSLVSGSHALNIDMSRIPEFAEVDRAGFCMCCRRLGNLRKTRAPGVGPPSECVFVCFADDERGAALVASMQS